MIIMMKKKDKKDKKDKKESSLDKIYFSLLNYHAFIKRSRLLVGV